MAVFMFQTRQFPTWMLMKRRTNVMGTCLVVFFATLYGLSGYLRRWIFVRTHEQRIEKLRSMLETSSSGISSSSMIVDRRGNSIISGLNILVRRNWTSGWLGDFIAEQIGFSPAKRVDSQQEQDLTTKISHRFRGKTVGDTPLIRLGIEPTIVSWSQIMRYLRGLVPGWQDVEAADIHLTRLKGAMTNYMLLCEAKNVGECHKLLIRIYGPNTDKFFPREREVEVFCKLSEKGFGPKLIGLFKQGRFEEFLEVEQLTKNDLRDETTMKLIAERMCEMHHFTKYFENLEVPHEFSPESDNVHSEIWDILQDWLLKAAEASRLISSRPDRMVRIRNLPLSMLSLILIKLKSNIEAASYRVSFCHNDVSRLIKSV
jgi:thiamine kinase-like enzyme